MLKRSAFLAVLLAASSAQAAHTRVTNPNALSVELLGRGMLYTVNFDRVLDDDLVAGVGFGETKTRFAGGGGDTNVSATMIPAYANYYFSREQGSAFATGGVTIVPNASSVQTYESTTGGLKFSSSPVIPTVGLGYENRGDAGSLFRIGVYAIIGGTIKPWAGLTFGYAF